MNTRVCAYFCDKRLHVAKGSANQVNMTLLKYRYGMVATGISIHPGGTKLAAWRYQG